MNSKDNTNECTSSALNIKSDPSPNVKSDHYFENGYMVFTAAYHIRRGYCCKNGCRHCPYGFRKKQ